MDKLTRNMHNGEIKVITGIRRCGKSVLLFELFADYLLQNGVSSEQIIKIALDKRIFYKFRNPLVLCDYVEKIVTTYPDRQFYLLLDEVQFTQSYTDKENGDIEVTIYDMLNELRGYKNLDVYVTGSNSKMLSSDIATEFRGRATQIHVYPLCFAEYYDHYSAWGLDEYKAMQNYMLYGGMPRLLNFADESDKKAYLSELFSELYIKDIIERNRVERADLIGDIMDFLASQTGCLTNPTNIVNSLRSMKKEKICHETVVKYLSHIENAFILSEAKRYDVKGKSYFDYPSKYYFTDCGLRNARLNYRQYDPGHIMENIIYNELKRLGYSVDVGSVADRRQGANSLKEIDFVVNHADKRIYIQSAYQMNGEAKTSSELDSLKLTKDLFAKIIIRMDIPHSYYDENGIFHCNLIDFLLGKVTLI